MDDRPECKARHYKTLRGKQTASCKCKMKRQPLEWGKTFTKKATDKRLISKIYKQLMQLNKKKKKFHQKIGGRPKQTFLQEDIQMANKHIKRCSTMLIIKEM